MESPTALPLSPYRVLDLTDEKGILCGKILADLGADVIKVERPGGDPSRNIGPFYHDIPDPEKSLFWFAFNTNKRSITLDIKTADGQKIFKKLVERADFVVESFPPGYLRELGLDYPVLSEINPRIIMTSITPFGQDGPYQNYKCSDLIASAMGGLSYICGDPDRPPVRISAEQAYSHAGSQAAVATLIANHYRQATGEGQHIDVSIQECIVWTLMYTIPYWDFGKRPFPRSGNLQSRYSVNYHMVFPCKDGWISCRLLTGLTWGRHQRALVAAMDSEGMAADLKEVDWDRLSYDERPQQDIDHWEEVTMKYFKKHTKAELLEKAREWGLMISPVNSTEDILQYQQLQERDYWARVDHPELGTVISYPGNYFKSTQPSWRIKRAPLIGEHNLEVYEQELGLSRKEIITLKEGGII